MCKSLCDIMQQMRTVKMHQRKINQKYGQNRQNRQEKKSDASDIIFPCAISPCSGGSLLLMCIDSINIYQMIEIEATGDELLKSVRHHMRPKERITSVAIWLTVWLVARVYSSSSSSSSSSWPSVVLTSKETAMSLVSTLTLFTGHN